MTLPEGFEGTEAEYAKVVEEAKETYGPFTGKFKEGDRFRVTEDDIFGAAVFAGDEGTVVGILTSDVEGTDPVAYAVVMDEPRDGVMQLLAGALTGYEWQMGERGMAAL